MDFTIVGTGRMGKSHIAAALGEGHKLVGICDRSRERMSEVAAEFGLDPAACFDRADDMFARTKAPLVLIASTADTHASLTLDAVKNGATHILCEKPMATSIADCDRMIEACSNANVKLAINHQMRFMDQYTRIKEEIGSGRHGKLGSMCVTAGCFGLAMNGSHYVEAFRFLTGSRVKTVIAHFSPTDLPNPRGPQFQDKAGEILCIAESGQRLIISAGADHGHGMTVTYATELGHIFCDELEGVYYATSRKPEHRSMPPTRYGMPWERHQHTFEAATNQGTTASVIRALIKGEDYPTGENGRDVVATLVAAHKSAAQGGIPADVSSLGHDYHRIFPWA